MLVSFIGHNRSVLNRLTDAVIAHLQECPRSLEKRPKLRRSKETTQSSWHGASKSSTLLDSRDSEAHYDISETQGKASEASFISLFEILRNNATPADVIVTTPLQKHSRQCSDGSGIILMKFSSQTGPEYAMSPVPARSARCAGQSPAHGDDDDCFSGIDDDYFHLLMTHRDCQQYDAGLDTGTWSGEACWVSTSWDSAASRAMHDDSLAFVGELDMRPSRRADRNS